MEEPLDLSGRELGRYHLLSLLGAGGMGGVYEAVDETLGRHVALKILPPELVGDADRVRRFSQEARAASALNHPYVITVYDIGTHDIDGKTLHFIAMEKVGGRTLREILGDGPLPVERAVELMLQVTEAIAAAHAAGIVHRDLKPENVMITTGGYAKVLDFGLAKLQEEPSETRDPNTSTDVMLTGAGTILGTAGYMAPEQAAGRRADHRADIFSIGCVLYEVVSGRRAFRGMSTLDTLHRIVHDEPEALSSLVPDLPPELARIVGKALAKDPEERYQSARELAVDLRVLLRQLHSDDAGSAVVLEKRRSWTLPLVAIASLILIASAAIWATLRWQHRTGSAEGRGLDIERVTSSGDVISAVISPDGKYISYCASNSSGQSLWVQQLATGQRLLIVPPIQHAAVYGQSFTPDGNAVVYVLVGSSDPNGTLYRISTLGGQPERLFEGIEDSPSFSPDGRLITYLRRDFPRRGESALMVASSDGAGAHAIATKRYPEFFAPIFFGGPSWSPDGSMIATAVARAENRSASLFAFDPVRGTTKPLSDGNWSALAQPAWLPDMTGLVVVGTRKDDHLASAGLAARLWFVPYPSGTPRQIIKDLLWYRAVTISADGRFLLTVGTDVSSQLWRVPLENSERPQKISTGRLDAWEGLSLTPDARIIFSAVESDIDLVITNGDGGYPQPLTRPPAVAIFPAAFPNGFAFVAPSPTGYEVRATGYDLHGTRTIVHGVDSGPIDVSRDGQWLAYNVDRRLWKIRMDGTGAKQLRPDQVSFASWSPTGDRLAILYNDGRDRLGVLPADGGAATWSAPVTLRGRSTVRWSPVGNSLLVNDFQNDRANIWRIPFTGPPQKLTALEEQDAYFFDVLPDGKTAIVCRGRLSRDAVLITGFH
ncbi:MAG TPA: protein kinase [Thermoanaerobaculia bacterium]|jgi:serine/threonine protein kinase|nr:protein kinase [Thermoanaerobaculia bacterium]